MGRGFQEKAEGRVGPLGRLGVRLWVFNRGRTGVAGGLARRCLPILLFFCLFGCDQTAPPAGPPTAPPKTPTSSPAPSAGLQLRIRRVPTGDARPNVVKVIEELENTSPHPVLVREDSIDREIFVTGEWCVIGGRHELTRHAKSDGPPWPPGSSGVISGGPPEPETVNPEKKISAEPYTLAFHEGARYQLESVWTVSCGNRPKELVKRKFNATLEIEVPEGIYDAPPGIEWREIK